MQKVVITGASGPIGIMLIKECLKYNIEVVAIIRPGSKRKKDISITSNVRVIECDIADIDQIGCRLSGKYDTFYHLAWTNTGDGGRNNLKTQEANIQYTLAAAKLAVKLGCTAFVGAGSQAEYGLHNSIINEKSKTNPVTPYGIAKLKAGTEVMEYCLQQNIRCNWVRIFTVYGPYENEYVLTSYLIQTFLKGERPSVTPCEQIWDFLYCEDAARALLLIGKCSQESKIYCLGSGEQDLLKNYVITIRNMINSKLEIGFAERTYAENQIMYLAADIEELKKDVGFKVEYGFKEGIKKTIAWYRNR